MDRKMTATEATAMSILKRTQKSFQIEAIIRQLIKNSHYRKWSDFESDINEAVLKIMNIETSE